MAFLISFCLHTIFIFLLFLPKQREKILPVDIVILERPKYKSVKASSKKGIGQIEATPIPLPLFDSNGPDVTAMPLDKFITASNYFDRIRGIIQPYWEREALDRMGLRIRTGLGEIICNSNFLIQVNSEGSLILIKLVESCLKDPVFDKVVFSTFETIGRLPPPPKLLLDEVTKTLVISWTFSIK